MKTLFKRREYVIYKIKCGPVTYIGHTTNFKRRIKQHKKQLEELTHANDLLQSYYLTNRKFNAIIIKKLKTFSRRKVLKVEQRCINLYANGNEATAAKNFRYDWEEIRIDLFDLLLKGLGR